MKKLSLCLAFLAVSLTRVAATEYAFGDFDVTLNNSGGTAFIVPLQLELGKFNTGFTPTTANADLWSANWVSGPTGFYDPSGGADWETTLTLVNNSTFALNAQLYLWAFNAKAGPGREWALFTDTTWKIAANSAIDPTIYSFDFSVASSALVGALNLPGDTARTAAISSPVLTPVPEPATWGLVAGVSTLVVALWRRRRSA